MKIKIFNSFSNHSAKIVALFILLFVSAGMNLKAQTISTYNYAETAGTYTPIVGTSMLAGALDDGVSAMVNIGFNFTYHGMVFTQFAAESNGYIILGGTGTALSNALTTVPNCIAFCNGDGKTNTGVFYLLTGTTPNRVLTVQFPDWYVYYASTTETLNAQIKLYETTNVVQIVYGTSTHTTSYTRQVGLTGAAVTDFSVRTSATSWSSTTAAAANSANMTWSSTVFPANGQTYTWTPPPPCSGTPAPGNTLSSMNPACASQSFVLSLSNTMNYSAITYQWQSSSDGVTWTNIPGANSSTYTATQATATYYQCVVTCTSSGLSATSTSLYVTMDTPFNCYCINVNTVNTFYYISSFSTTGGSTNITNNTGFSPNGYGNYTGMVVTQLQTGVINFTLTQTGGSAYFGIWVDWNNDGDFLDAGENVYLNNTTYSVTVTGSFTVPFSATPGNHRMRVVQSDVGAVDACLGSAYTECEDYTVNVVALPPCAGMPNPGNTVSSYNPVCDGIAFVLSFSNTLNYSGLTFQWQSSPDGITWTNIPGANSPTYSTTQSTATYYQCIVTCTSAGLTSISTPLYVTMNSILNCYCQNVNTVNNYYYISSFSTTGGTTNINNNTGFSPNGYGDYTAMVVTQIQTGVINFTITQTGGSAYFGIWVDWNNDGDFVDAGENVYINNTSYSVTVSGSFTVPFSAAPGNHRMRVVQSDVGAVTACGGSSYTECEDYTIVVTALPPCVGMPNAGTASISSSAGCANSTFILNSTGFTMATGITYQWQSSPDGISGWTNIPGATNPTYPYTTTTTAYFRLIILCANSGMSSVSNVVSYTVGTGCCMNTLSLYDTGGDGWSGGSVSLWVNGNLMGTYTLAAGAGPYSIVFGVSAGEGIEITYTAGTDGTQNYFNVTNASGGFLVQNWYPYNSGSWFGIGCPPPVQPPCTNLGFENGFAGWFGTAGNSVDGALTALTPVYQPHAFGTTTGTNFAIVSGGTDPYGLFPCVYSGTSSVKIGNVATYETYNAVSLEQNFQVTAANTNFTYNYAVVLQDGTHPAYEQPFFQIDVFDQTGAPVACGLYQVAAPGTGFIQSSTSDVFYKPWTPVSVNLASFVGQTITVRFTVSDCSLGAHFGYAYLDCSCDAFGLIAPDTICQGQTATLNAPAGSQSYLWAPGGAITPTINVSPTTTTTYSCTMTTQGNVPCVFTLTSTVVVSPPLIISASSNSPVCIGQTLELTSLPDTAFSYSWTGPNSFTSNLQNPTIANITPAAAGTYTVTISKGGCTATATTLVSVGSATVVASSNSPICNGTTLNFTSSAGGTIYSWTGPNSFVSAIQNPSITNATPSTAGTYSVTITFTGGCTGSATVTVAFNSNLVITPTATPASICLGTSTSLSATSSSPLTSFIWMPDSLLGSPITVSPTTTTTYSVLGSTTAGCTGTATVLVTVNPNPTVTATASPPAICNGALSSLAATSNISGMTYTWMPGNLSGPTVSVSPSNTTSYIVTGVAAGCSGFDTVTVTVNPNPIISASATPAAHCIGDTNSSSLSATSTVTGTTYLWLPGNLTGSTVSVLPNSTTVYTVTGTSAASCSGSALTTVTINPLPVITFIPMPILCVTSPVFTLNQASPAGGTYSGTGVVGNTFDPALAGIGTHTITYNYTNPTTGCSNSGSTSITITVGLTIPVTPSNTTICKENSVVLFASGATTYIWTPATGLNTSSGPVVIAHPTENTVYTITASNPDGCAGSNTISVNLFDTQVVNITATPNHGCSPLDVIFNYAPVNLIQDSTWHWNFDDNFSSNNTSEDSTGHHFYEHSGSYMANFTAKDINGCVISATANVEVYVVPQADFGFNPQTGIAEVQPIIFDDLSTYANYWFWDFGDPNSHNENNSDQANPTHMYADSGTYTVILIATTIHNCSDTVSHEVIINPGLIIYIPNAFTPNGDGKNEFFLPVITGLDKSTYQVIIYDRWGKEEFKSNTPDKGWDGKYNGKNSQEGVYTYIVTFNEYSGKRHKYVGSVTLIR
ncbi:MAG: GEVED domain-containing protein [Bacteroidota bacterium]